MAYEFLQKLFGEPKEGEQPKSMTFAELEAALNGATDVQIVNLKEGGYVSKEKFDSKDAELKGVKAQLTAANEQIQSFKGKATDIDVANQKVAEWESKYNTDTKALQDQLTAQARSHAEDMFLSGYKFTSKAARKGILDDFREQNFQLADDGTFKGGKEYMESLMKNEDYKGAFVVEGESGDNGEGQGNQNQNQNPGQNGRQNPRFAQGTNGGQEGAGGNQNPFNFSFTRLRQPPANNQ